MAWWRWAVWALAALVIGGIGRSLVTHKTDRHYYTYKTLQGADMLVEACRAYHKRSGGKYPAALSDLATQPDGGGPILDTRSDT